MRASLVTSLTVVLSLAWCSAQNTTDEQKVKQLEANYYQAFNDGDFEGVQGFETLNFIVQSGKYLYGKGEQLGNFKRYAPEHAKYGPREQKVNISDQHFQRYDDVLIVSEFVTMKGGGQPDHRMNVTEVWVEGNGQWKLAHLHYQGIDDHCRKSDAGER